MKRKKTTLARQARIDKTQMAAAVTGTPEAINGVSEKAGESLDRFARLADRAVKLNRKHGQLTTRYVQLSARFAESAEATAGAYDDAITELAKVLPALQMLAAELQTAQDRINFIFGEDDRPAAPPVTQDAPSDA